MRDLMKDNIRVDQSFTVKNEILTPPKIKQSQTRSSFSSTAGFAVNETRVLGRHSWRGEPRMIAKSEARRKDYLEVDETAPYGLPRPSRGRTNLAAPASQEPLCSQKPTLENPPTFLEENDDWEDEEKLLASLPWAKELAS
ncbi:hypothetical protein LTS18_005688 [Coniosporium uncinatum]|uniref:Uncharacterized protein n=1 Tax=Coniosporium uncinatum TaxID=93489 RepID=A0ACC3DR76_9PEZI|nr:hypothetical protein LTS18_005688 [Coniosporium uncinatum]